MLGTTVSQGFFIVRRVRAALDALDTEIASLNSIVNRFRAFAREDEELNIGDNVSFSGRVKLTGSNHSTPDVTGAVLLVTERWVHIEVERYIAEDEEIVSEVYRRLGRNLRKIGRHINVTNF